MVTKQNKTALVVASRPKGGATATKSDKTVSSFGVAPHQPPPATMTAASRSMGSSGSAITSGRTGAEAGGKAAVLNLKVKKPAKSSAVKETTSTAAAVMNTSKTASQKADGGGGSGNMTGIVLSKKISVESSSTSTE